MKAGKIPIITQNEFIMTYKAVVAKDALINAEKDAKEKAKNSGILEAAAENAETIITAIVEPNLDGRKLEIVHK